jgi:hypothetical protein
VFRRFLICNAGKFAENAEIGHQVLGKPPSFLHVRVPYYELGFRFIRQVTAHGFSDIYYVG